MTKNNNNTHTQKKKKKRKKERKENENKNVVRTSYPSKIILEFICFLESDAIPIPPPRFHLNKCYLLVKIKSLTVNKTLFTDLPSIGMIRPTYYSVNNHAPVATIINIYKYGPRQANLCLRAFRHDKFQLRISSHSEGPGIWFSV